MENVDIMINLAASEATVDKEIVDLLIPSAKCLFKAI